MKTLPPLFAILCLTLFPLNGCKQKGSETVSLNPGKDPIEEEINSFRMDTRQAYNTRNFDLLETRASELREKKQVFANGSWKIVQFYDSLTCSNSEKESMWELHEEIHKAWIAAKPDSITARIAYASFLVDYGWHARGTGFANTVSNEGARLLEKRLDAAWKVLKESRSLADKDPYFWMVALDVALGQGWSRTNYEELVAEAHAFEPTFWGYDTSRAWSLMPRWYGDPGDWEEYAMAASARPDGLGAEVYARIVIRLEGYYENVFSETKASWEKTREGLAQIREKYPTSIETISYSAKLAVLAGDRDLAKEMFDRLGNVYLPYVWREPTTFVRAQKWAQTGE